MEKIMDTPLGEKEKDDLAYIPYDLNKADEEMPDLPLEYYDNDDGFWDDYIVQKKEHYAKFMKITHLKYLKH
jgi:hypothetical protein